MASSWSISWRFEIPLQTWSDGDTLGSGIQTMTRSSLQPLGEQTRSLLVGVLFPGSRAEPARSTGVSPTNAAERVNQVPRHECRRIAKAPGSEQRTNPPGMVVSTRLASRAQGYLREEASKSHQNPSALTRRFLLVAPDHMQMFLGAQRVGESVQDPATVR